MSYSKNIMKTMGETNAGWGVCGFTSCLYAMYDLNPSSRRMLISAPQAWSVLYEIEEYLETLKQKNETRLKGLIEGFTRSFGGEFADFTVDRYIENIRADWDKYATKNSGDINSLIKDDAKFGIALPPDVVVDYLQRMWKYDARFQFTGTSSDGIVGVKVPNDKNMWMYGGLCHYVYQKGGKIYSWGQTFNSVLEAGQKGCGADFEVCCMITF